MKLFTAQTNNKKISLQKGFTLIELLVVIGILGILAASLVATIDPFEQLKKANDSKVQNVAVEFQTGLIRYYTSQGQLPWQVTGACATDTSAAPSTGIFATPVTLEDVEDSCIQDLIDLGELKSGFTDITGALENVEISSPTENSTVVCYEPTSNSGQKDPATKYNNVGVEQAANECYSNGGTLADKCFWCAK